MTQHDKVEIEIVTRNGDMWLLLVGSVVYAQSRNKDYLVKLAKSMKL